MTDSSRSRKKSAGALPMPETRSEYARLMRQGISNAEACRMLKINRRTGMRWRHGRTVKNAHGRETTYAPISKAGYPFDCHWWLSYSRLWAARHGRSWGGWARLGAGNVGPSGRSV